MSIRDGSRCAATIAIGYVLSVAVSTVPALGHAAASGEEATAGTLAWLGCWRLEATGEGDVPESADASQLLCLEPGDGPSSLRPSAIVDDQVVAEELLVADGIRRPVSEGRCSGWRRSLLSADKRRLYLQSETTCEGSNQSSLSGASLIVSGGHWVDINVTRVDGERELVVRHYRLVDADTALLPGTLSTAGRTARVAAAAPLDEDDVIEALEYLDPAVVEAMLVESRSTFPMDSGLLLRLDDAGVPGQIIDLMMALSYPEYFAVERSGGIERLHPEARDGTVYTQPLLCNHFYHSWPTWFHGYGCGHGYGYGCVHPPHDPDSRPGPRGWVISGRGYTRVQPVNPPSGVIGLLSDGTGQPPSSPHSGSSSTGDGGSSQSSGGSEDSASQSGYQKGSSTSTRKAVPR
jgi:hypothetical protein